MRIDIPSLPGASKTLPEDKELPNITNPNVAKVFDKPKEFKTTGTKKKDIPQGMWTRCKGCTEMISNLELQALQKVCPKCQYHFTATASERISWLFDAHSFAEMDEGLASVDALKFKGVQSYSERLKTYQKETGLRDAVITGIGKMDGHLIGMAAMDFAFLGASMGSVVGEKITRVVERSTEQRIPVVIISTSGGARMYEGMLSLMQLAKTSAAIAHHAQAHLPFISILTNPTMAGVMASFASLGDVIIAEPQSMIGFAGARVIRETTREELPPGFQTAEHLLEHGLIDRIVHRKNMKSTLSRLLEYMS
jgi:acetyl-CoA carboxylase carboxyl transferase subunit beta